MRRNAPLCARSLSLFWRAQPTALQHPPPAQRIPGEAGVLLGGVHGLSQACAEPLRAREVEDWTLPGAPPTGCNPEFVLQVLGSIDMATYHDAMD